MRSSRQPRERVSGSACSIGTFLALLLRPQPCAAGAMVHVNTTRCGCPLQGNVLKVSYWALQRNLLGHPCRLRCAGAFDMSWDAGIAQCRQESFTRSPSKGPTPSTSATCTGIKNQAHCPIPEPSAQIRVLKTSYQMSLALTCSNWTLRGGDDIYARLPVFRAFAAKKNIGFWNKSRVSNLQPVQKGAGPERTRCGNPVTRRFSH